MPRPAPGGLLLPDEDLASKVFLPVCVVVPPLERGPRRGAAGGRMRRGRLGAMLSGFVLRNSAGRGGNGTGGALAGEPEIGVGASA